MSLGGEERRRADRFAAVLGQKSEDGAHVFDDAELLDFVGMMCLEIVRADPSVSLPAMCLHAVMHVAAKLKIDAGTSAEEVRARIARYTRANPPSARIERAMLSFVREELASGARSADGRRFAAFTGERRALPARKNLDAPARTVPVWRAAHTHRP